MESNESGTQRDARHGSGRFTLAGIDVREEDVDSATGLVIVGIIIRIAAVIILLLAIWQAWDWMRDPPPGGAGMSVIIGDTVRLVVTATLLYAASNLADVIITATHEMRASRILLARQTYLMRQMMGTTDLKSTLPDAGRGGAKPGTAQDG